MIKKLFDDMKNLNETLCCKEELLSFSFLTGGKAIQKGNPKSKFAITNTISLAGTIHFQRPDLLPDNAETDRIIPPNPSNDLAPGIKLLIEVINANIILGSVPDVGELMLASFSPYILDISAEEYWYSKK